MTASPARGPEATQTDLPVQSLGATRHRPSQTPRGSEEVAAVIGRVDETLGEGTADSPPVKLPKGARLAHSPVQAASQNHTAVGLVVDESHLDEPGDDGLGKFPREPLADQSVFQITR